LVAFDCAGRSQTCGIGQSLACRCFVVVVDSERIVAEQRFVVGGAPVILVASGLDDDPYSSDPEEANAVLQMVRHVYVMYRY
jgi:hypothetical protein